jgi:hypothetical protein
MSARRQRTTSKTAADDVKHAMEKLENNIPTAVSPVEDTYGTPEGQEQAADRTIQ